MRLEDLLKLETEELLKFKFQNENVLMWPFVRYSIFSKILQKYNDYNTPHASREKLDMLDIVSYFKATLKYNPYKYNNYAIVFFTTALDNTFKINSKYFNRVYDYFGLEYQNSTLILEDSGRRKYRLPIYFKNYASNDYVRILISARAKFDSWGYKDREKIYSFIKYIREIFGSYLDLNDIQKIQNTLININRRLYFINMFYKKLFLKLKPQIIFINCASYGGEGYLIKIAKDMGIKVGEFQHGLISNQHPAYNYSSIICNSSEYKRYLPDYILTYGRYWVENIKHPAKKIIIGNPHFDAMLNRCNNNILKENNAIFTIMIVSQGIITNKFVEIAKTLSRMLKKSDYSIIFRLHPGEVPFEDRYKSLYLIPSISISKNGDIYDLIYQSDAIIAYNSTTIFEALPFNKPIFILDDKGSRESIPNDIGIWFKSVEELVQKIKNLGESGIKFNYNINYYWADNWKSNYRAFIKEEIGIN